MKKAFLTIFSICASLTFFAQCDTIASICSEKNFTNEYVSDGQQYRALLISEDIAEFKSTFYGGSTYRVSACSGETDGNLIFSLYDNNRNLLFTNKEHGNAPYWDFKMESTVDGYIEAQLNELGSGCAVLLIGFKLD